MRGYSLPLSPTGFSSMLSQPPWHFSGDMLWINYHVEPDAAQRFLPAGLELGADAGSAAAVFAEWQWCSDSGDELRDPGTCQFKEFVLLLSARHRDQPVARCPYAWVDKPVPMIRGWVQGMPKCFGSIAMSHTVVTGRAGPRKITGETFRGTLAVNDRRIVSGALTLTGSAEHPPALSRVPLVHTRLFPAWDSSTDPLQEIVTTCVTDVEFSTVMTGDAVIEFLDIVDPDLATLAPTHIQSGFLFSYGETLIGGKRLSLEEPSAPPAHAETSGMTSSLSR
jgi:enduracididine biosynthesis enzyme MppR